MAWFFLALASAFFSGSSAILEKKILFKTHVVALCFLGASLNLVLMVPFLLGTFHFTALTGSALGVVLLKSVLAATGYFFLMKAMKNLEISGTLPLMVLTPGLVAVLELVFLGQYLTFEQVGGIVLLLVGTYILQIREGTSLFQPFLVFIRSKDHHSILMAIGLMTLSAFLDKVALGRFKVPAVDFMILQHVFFFIFFGALFWGLRGGQHGPRVPLLSVWKTSWFWFVGLALFTVFYRYSQILAVQQSSAALVLSVKRMSVLFAALVGGHLFRETHLVRKGIAAAIMIAGSTLVLIA